MEHTTVYLWIMVAILFAIAFFYGRKQRTAVAAAVHHLKKSRKGSDYMEALAKQFINKDVIIYTVSSDDGSINGVLKAVDGGGLLIEDKAGQLQAINLEYITRIREYPLNKKGKKKAIVAD